MGDRAKAVSVLTMNTLAFTVCFACWMTNGVLITFLVENQLFHFDKIQMGWLIGIPVLAGSLVRLPLGVLTDRYGGRIVYSLLLLLCAVPMYMLGHATTFVEFLLASLGFGLTGGAFAVGIAYTSVWFSKGRQGLALGIFGTGNAGAAVTTLAAPHLLRWLTDHGTRLEGWRTLPKIYAAALAMTAILFFLSTYSRRVEETGRQTLIDRLRPLANVRVWRFGLYYFFVFGGFVALAQWLVPYYVSAYSMSLAMAGMLAAIYSLPSGVIRALGGWLSDRFGARAVMYWVYGGSVLCCALLLFPRMDVQSPGPGVMAARSGVVTAVSEDRIVVGNSTYALLAKAGDDAFREGQTLVLPIRRFWQEPVVKVGDKVEKKQLLAKGVTHVYFQANVWIFTGIVFVLGILMGFGKAAVYKHIPDYFPREVGVVGGIVGVIGGLGGFFCPILFGYLLQWTGIWTTCWLFFLVLTVVSLAWMHSVVRKMMREQVPDLVRRIENLPAPPPVPAPEVERQPR